MSTLSGSVDEGVLKQGRNGWRTRAAAALGEAGTPAGTSGSGAGVPAVVRMVAVQELLAGPRRWLQGRRGAGGWEHGRVEDEEFWGLLGVWGFKNESSTGRRRRFCDAACRSKARRLRATEQMKDPSLLPFAVATRTATSRSGLSLRQLATELDGAGYNVSVSTLSQWSRGLHLPYPSETVRHRLFMLERFGQLHTGDLVRALLSAPGRSSSPHVPRQRAPFGRRLTVDQAYQVALERIADIDGSDPSFLVQAEQSEHYFVGPRRIPTHTDISLTVNALRDTEAYWHIHGYDPQAPLTVAAGQGCTARLVLDDIPLGHHSRAKYQIVATKLRFDRPLKAGDEYSFSFRTRYAAEVSGPLPRPEFRRLVTTPATRRVEVAITFDPRAEPVNLHRAH